MRVVLTDQHSYAGSILVYIFVFLLQFPVMMIYVCVCVHIFHI